MRTGAEIKVGLITLAAVALLAVFAYYIKGQFGAARTYTLYVTFDNARGLQRGDPVYMAGVKIGEVRAVTITPPPQQAEVPLAIARQYALYSRYVFQIATGGLIEERSIEVIPTRPEEFEGARLGDGMRVQGIAAPDLADIVKAGQEVLTSLNRTSEQVRKLLGSEEIIGGVKRALDSFAAAADAAARVALAAAAITEKSEPETRTMLVRLREAATDIQASAKAVRASTEQGTALQDFEATSRHLREASRNTAQLTEALEELVSDPRVKSDLRASLASIRDAAESLKRVGEDLEAFSGELRKAAPAVPKVAREAERISDTVAQLEESLKPPEAHPNLRLLYSPKAEHTIATGDLDFNYPATPQHFLRLGIDDIGEESKANIQLGERHPLGTLRYGLIRSRLGVGFDFRLPRGSRFTCDLFDPNAVRADVFADVPLGGSDWGALVGVRDLGGEDLFVAGARLRR